jgi:hypothetical protein
MVAIAPAHREPCRGEHHPVSGSVFAGRYDGSPNYLLCDTCGKGVGPEWCGFCAEIALLRLDGPRPTRLIGRDGWLPTEERCAACQETEPAGGNSHGWRFA